MGTQLPLPKKGTGAEPTIFGPCLLWPNGFVDMPLGMEIGLGSGHIVLDGDPVPLPNNGAQPSPIFGPCLLWPNGWMDQDATWYDGRPRPGQHCVRCGRSFTPKELSPKFRPILLWSNGWMDQYATWYEGRSRPIPEVMPPPCAPRAKVHQRGEDLSG